MSPQDVRNERVRAWVFAQAEPAEEVAERLYDKLGHEGGDRFVVVRANIVTGAPYNIVVPVDAESHAVLQEVAAMIQGVSGVKETQVVAVVKHFPWPPHDAHGFITPDEQEAGRDPEADVGRFPQSPGFNAWG